MTPSPSTRVSSPSIRKRRPNRRKDGGSNRFLWHRPVWGERNLPTLSAVVMAYTGHSELVPRTIFVAVGERDGIAPPFMERRVPALRKAGTELEHHRYRGVGMA